MKIILIVLFIIGSLISCTETQPIENNNVILYNYFPLELNDTLSFNYNRTFHSPGVLNVESCILTWIIDNRELVDSSIHYSVTENLEGIGIAIKVIDDQNNYHIDTTYEEITRKFSFVIVETDNGLEFVKNDPYALTIPLNGLIFQTKFLDSRGEVFYIFDDENWKLSLRINEGLDFYYSKSAVSNNWDELEVKRIY